MVIFRYDKTFEGLLTVVFEAYDRKKFPDLLLSENETAPLFYEQVIFITTDEQKANRVWKGLERKISRMSLSCLAASWLSELPEIDRLLFRYIRKAIDTPQSIEMNFGDADVLQVVQIAKKVSREKHRVVEFVRFQKTQDDTYFAALKPLYNVLSLTVRHFQNRFAQQKWLIYDLKRGYGYYYDLSTVTEIYFEQQEAHLISGILNEELLATDEKLFQDLWKAYFKATTIKERINPKLHRQNMPVRFWKYMTEKQ